MRNAIAAPAGALQACVVVPARDEEERIGACLGALGAQTGLEPGSWEVLLVLDRCRDRTRERALGWASSHPHVALRLLDGPGTGSGGARATGMDAACERLERVGRPYGLIASTDADTRAAADWLARQLELVRTGARAIGGRIEMCPRERAGLPGTVVASYREQSLRRFERVLAQMPDDGSVAEHWQFSGASIGVTAATYREAGGLGDGEHSEDERLERALLERGVPIERRRDVRVTTSARMDGRASYGLARLLRELAAEPSR